MGETGTVQGMGMDGRVRVSFDDEQAEDRVWLRTRHAAVKDLTKGGVWLDLTKVEHTFAEETMEQMAVLPEIPMTEEWSLMQRVVETTARGALATENQFAAGSWDGRSRHSVAQRNELQAP